MSKFDFRSKSHFRCAVCMLFVGFGSSLGFAQTAPRPNASTPNPTNSPGTASAPTTTGDSAVSEFDTPRKLLREGKFDDAIATLENLQTKNPAMPGLAHELGVAYYRKGDYLKAIAALQKAETENPKDAEATQLLGLSAYLSGRPA